MSLCLVIRWCWSSMALWLDRLNIKIIRSTYTLLSLPLFLSISSWAHTMYAVCGMLLELCLPNLLLFCYLDQYSFNCCKHFRQKTKRNNRTARIPFIPMVFFAKIRFVISLHDLFNAFELFVALHRWICETLFASVLPKFMYRFHRISKRCKRTFRTVLSLVQSFILSFFLSSCLWLNLELCEQNLRIFFS